MWHRRSALRRMLTKWMRQQFACQPGAGRLLAAAVGEFQSFESFKKGTLPIENELSP